MCWIYNNHQCNLLCFSKTREMQNYMWKQILIKAWKCPTIYHFLHRPYHDLQTSWLFSRSCCSSLVLLINHVEINLFIFTIFIALWSCVNALWWKVQIPKTFSNKKIKKLLVKFWNNKLGLLPFDFHLVT